MYQGLLTSSLTVQLPLSPPRMDTVGIFSGVFPVAWTSQSRCYRLLLHRMYGNIKAEGSKQEKDMEKKSGKNSKAEKPFKV